MEGRRKTLLLVEETEESYERGQENQFQETCLNVGLADCEGELRTGAVITAKNTKDTEVCVWYTGEEQQKLQCYRWEKKSVSYLQSLAFPYSIIWLMAECLKRRPSVHTRLKILSSISHNIAVIIIT
jgi:hypothetical protein